MKEKFTHHEILLSINSSKVELLACWSTLDPSHPEAREISQEYKKALEGLQHLFDEEWRKYFV